MECARCRQENLPQARFCQECGARLARACSACGTELRSGAKFCLQCGAPVATSEAAASARRPQPPRHLAEKILAAHARLEAEEIKMMVNHAQRVVWLGEAALLAGRSEEAAALGLRALDLARSHGERGTEAWALRLLGEIASHGEPAGAEAAREHYGQALALATELGMRPLASRCHLGLGRLYRRTDKRDQARERLRTATTMYREMDMRNWLVDAEEELRGLARRP